MRTAYKLHHPDRDRENRRQQSRRKTERDRKPPPSRRCENCGKVFIPNLRTPHQPYCLPFCRHQAYRRANAERIALQKKDQRRKYQAHIAAYVSRYKDQLRFSGNRLKALERDGYTCRNCGYAAPVKATNHSQDVVVHHLDFSGRAPHPNNRIENLQTLCRPCHIRLHTHQIVHNR